MRRRGGFSFLWMVALCAHAQKVDYIQQVQNKPVIDVREYRWARTVGTGLTGNLSSAGSGKALTFSSCPRGMSGAFALQKIYLSGGTGTAEVVPVTGGTCTSGSSNGTLLVTTVNPHTGSWKAESSTAGIQETVHAAGAIAGGTTVLIPAGISTVRAGIAIPYGQVGISGVGLGITRILPAAFSTEDLFLFSGSGNQFYNSIRNLSIEGSPAQTAGWAINAVTQEYFVAERLQIIGYPNGIRFMNAHISQVSDVYISDHEDVTGIGMHIEGTSSYVTRIDRLVVQGNNAPGGTSKPFAGLRIRQVADVIVRDSHFITNTYGMLVDPGNGMLATSIKAIASYFDNSWTDGVRIAPQTGGVVQRCDFGGSWFSDSKGGAGMNISDSGGGNVDGIAVDTSQFFRNAGPGLFVDGAGGLVANVRAANNVLAGNSNGSSGTYSGAIFNTSNFSFLDNRSGPVNGFSNSQSYGLAVFAAGNNNYTVTGNDLVGNMTGAMVDAGNGPSKVIRANRGLDDAWVSKAAGAAFALGPERYYYISGTTPITSFTGAHNGREVIFIFTAGAPGGIVAGGNIVSAPTVAQNVPVFGYFINSQWYFR